MSGAVAPPIDARGRDEVLAALDGRRAGFVPTWSPRPASADAALAQIHAHLISIVLDRLNQAPERNKLAFLSQLGIEQTPAQPARAAVVFAVEDQAPAAPTPGVTAPPAGRPPLTLPAGTPVAAPPPPEASDQIVFETERPVALSPAKLVQVFSLWPGRDQYIDHGPALAVSTPFQPFGRADLEDVPHVLYIAHDLLLALQGRATVDVDFSLTQPSSEPLAVLWEYWNGSIWRRFEGQVTRCGGDDGENLDGTARFTRSGRFRLSTDCAEAAKIAIAGREAFWIRGRLTETLPLDPQRILPDVDWIRLSTVVERPLTNTAVRHQVSYEQAAGLSAGAARAILTLTDADGIRLDRATLRIIVGGSIHSPRATTGDGDVEFDLPLTPGDPLTIEIRQDDIPASLTVVFDPPRQENAIRVSAQIAGGGLLPDPAFADASALDVTKPFYPFGQQPQPGSAFYFACDDALSRPGARVQVGVRTTQTVQDSLNANVSVVPAPMIVAPVAGVTNTAAIPHVVVWEYWNGRSWAPLVIDPPAIGGGAEDFTADGIVRFIVPRDIVSTPVNEREALWIRVRVASGSFGFLQTVTWTDAGQNTNTFTFPVIQPPALTGLRIGYVWENGPYQPEAVLAYNDFRYFDRTEAALWPGFVFQPFTPPTDATPALFLGFDRSFPVDRLTLLFDITEVAADIVRPDLAWEYWAGVNWRHLSVEDETRSLGATGLMSFIGPADAQPLDRFGRALFWIRARLREVGLPFAPVVNRLHTNAAAVVQQQTLRDETLGRSTGLPRQVFRFRRFPVLAGEQLEVREAAGARASVEWRLIAAEVLGRPLQVRELERLVAQEGPHAEVSLGNLRLRRDRDKRVSEVWVRWQARRRLVDAGPRDRVYVLDRVTGQVRFGDGEHGRLPPSGADILARLYRAGGGSAGNVQAGAISQLLAGVAGVQSVTNPLAAEGGADAEPLEAVRVRGPRTLAHRGRAVTGDAFATMAFESSPAIAAAYAWPTLDAAGIVRAGWVTVIILPNSAERRPWPTFGLREQVRRYISDRMSASVAAAGGLYVSGPQYQDIDVDVVVAAVDIDRAGQAERGVRTAIQRFLHPILGGPTQTGWLPGRAVYASDIAAALEAVPEVDHLRELALIRDGRPLGEVADVGERRIAVAGTIHVRVV